jgi:hypothetical protein
MPFTKTFTAPNGATLNFHKVTRIEVVNDVLTYTVQSWVSEADYLASKPALWNSYLIGTIPPGLLASMEDAARLTPEFSGGIPVIDNADALQAAKDRAVARNKQERDKLAVSGFTVGSLSLASDAASQTKILLGVTQAILNPTTFSEPWLLADGTVQILNATQMRAVAKSLYDTIKALDVRLRDAQLAIQAATTTPAVEAVVL